MIKENNTVASEMPEAMVGLLLEAYQDYRKTISGSNRNKQKRCRIRIASLLHAGHSKGWRFKDLSKACGITPERVRQMVLDFPEQETLTEQYQQDLAFFPTYEQDNEQGEPRRRRPRKARLTESQRRELYELQKIARTTAGSTPLDSESRKASTKLAKKIIHYREIKVTWREIAEAMGITVAGARARAYRHGYNKGAPPSIAPYRGTTIAETRKDSRRKKKSKGRKLKTH